MPLVVREHQGAHWIVIELVLEAAGVSVPLSPALIPEVSVVTIRVGVDNVIFALLPFGELVAGDPPVIIPVIVRSWEYHQPQSSVQKSDCQ